MRKYNKFYDENQIYKILIIKLKVMSPYKTLFIHSILN